MLKGNAGRLFHRDETYGYETKGTHPLVEVLKKEDASWRMKRDEIGTFEVFDGFDGSSSLTLDLTVLLAFITCDLTLFTVLGGGSGAAAGFSSDVFCLAERL